MDMEPYDAVLGLDWLRQNNPYIDWATSTLTIKRNGVNHQIYPDTVHQLMQEHVFVRITESDEEQEDLGKINWGNCTFEVIHFKETRTKPPSKLEEIIINAFPSVFKETLPGLPPAKGIEHEITLKGSIPKARPLYRLTPAKDTALRAYLEEALKKGLI